MLRENLKKYHIKTGGIISVFIALLSFVPRLAQDSETEIAAQTVNLIMIFVFCMGCWLGNQYLVHSTKFPQKNTGQLLKISISFLASLIFSFLLLYLFRKNIAAQNFFFFRELKGKRAIVRMVLFRGTFLNSFLYFLSYILFLSAQSQTALLENQKLKHENLEAKLFILKQQLSPHFLFNSLGILNTLTPDENVHRYIQQLSNIYRYLLNSNSSHLATLKQETEFINSYLYILNERFEDALLVNITLTPQELDKQIPPAALQLLIENAIKHNVVMEDEPLKINIYTEGEFIVVSNNLNPKTYGSSESTGTGLHNISERYRLLGQESIIIQKDNANFTVKLPLIA